MGAPPYALSVSHFVSSVGADAGFAALIGLAILILLYFAQARETSSLRDRFEVADDQVHRLEQRLAQLSRATAASAAGQAPAPAPAGLQRQGAAASPAVSRRVAPQPAPAAPAFVGAPALAAATRFIPDADEAIAIRAQGARTAAPAARAQTAAPAARVPVGAGVAAGGGGSAGGPPDQGTSAQGGVAAPAGPAPATAAGAGVANGGGAPRSASGPSPTAAPKPYRIAGARPPGSTQPPRRPVALPPEPSRGRRGLLIVLGGVLLVAAVVAVVLVVTSNGGKSPVSGTSAATSTPTSTTHRRHARALPLKPSAITVAVLNGTSTTNLAHDVSLKLSGYGYRPGTIATATDQTQSATVVGFLPGQRRAALVVARSLNLGPASVQPVDQSNQAVACPQTTCTAEVVVTVGSDLASAASTTTSSTG